MALLEYNEIRERKVILHENEPFEVLSAHVFRKQQRKPVNATKLRNLITGRVAEVSFASSDKVEEVELIKRPAKYLYKNKNEFWFCDVENPAQRTAYGNDIVGDNLKYIKEGTVVELLIFETPDEEERVIGIKVPVKVELRVTDAPPSIKGNTAQGGNKVITLETGATINAPLFIEIGEIIKLNTETGEYIERVH